MGAGVQSVSGLGPHAPIPVQIDGILPTDAAELIRSRLAPVLGACAAHSRVRLTRLSEPGLVRPIVGQLDVQFVRGRVRAQVAAATMSEVALLLATRSAAQLRLVPGALAECLHKRSTTPTPAWSPELLPPGTRRLARHKMCLPQTATIDEAVGVLEAMDYTFHLFRERSSRQDSIVVRTSYGRYRIIQPAPDTIRSPVATTAVDLVPAPWRTVEEAIRRLDLTGSAFEIFADRATGRGSVLYARYDGHYGMLRPAAPLWYSP